MISEAYSENSVAIFRIPVFSGSDFSHTHSYSGWESDENGHWQKCLLCEESTETAAHTFDDGTVIKEPQIGESGEKQFECTVCGFTKTEEIPPLPYILGDANGDGVVTAADAELIANYNAGIVSDDEIDIDSADVSGDGRVDICDCIKIMLYLKGKISGR